MTEWGISYFKFLPILIKILPIYYPTLYVTPMGRVWGRVAY